MLLFLRMMKKIPPFSSNELSDLKFGSFISKIVKKKVSNFLADSSILFIEFHSAEVVG